MKRAQIKKGTIPFVYRHTDTEKSFLYLHNLFRPDRRLSGTA